MSAEGLLRLSRVYSEYTEAYHEYKRIEDEYYRLRKVHREKWRSYIGVSQERQMEIVKLSKNPNGAVTLTSYFKGHMYAVSFMGNGHCNKPNKHIEMGTLYDAEIEFERLKLEYSV